LELLAMFITSLCVDLDHGGVSDLFLVNTQSPLAQLYNNISVNENHHWCGKKTSRRAFPFLWRAFLAEFFCNPKKRDHFTKTGSGQT